MVAHDDVSKANLIGVLNTVNNKWNLVYPLHKRNMTKTFLKLKFYYFVSLGEVLFLF